MQREETDACEMARTSVLGPNSHGLSVGFHLDDAAHTLAMTSNTVNSFSQQALALQVTSQGYLRCLTRHLPTLQPSKVGSAQLEAVVDMMLMSQRFHLPWLPRSTQRRLYARA